MSCAVFSPPSSATRASRVTASRRAPPAETRGAAGVARASAGRASNVADADAVSLGRRSVASVALGSLLAAFASPALPSRAVENAKRAAGDTGEGPFCDYTQTLPCDEYPTYSRTETGLLFQDLRFGEGARVAPGKRVTADWDAYTFYLSHVVQARNLPKGGDFDGENADSRFLRFVPGDGSVIPAFDDAVAGMRVGGVRRFIVRPDASSYPGILTKRGGRFDEGVGPVPASLSGRRALEFVLRNTANVDKSLLFDVEILAVEGDGSVGFRRGPGAWAEGVAGKLS